MIQDSIPSHSNHYFKGFFNIYRIYVIDHQALHKLFLVILEFSNIMSCSKSGWFTWWHTCSSSSLKVCWSLWRATPWVISKFTSDRSIPIDFGTKFYIKLITNSRLIPSDFNIEVDLNSCEFRAFALKDNQNFPSGLSEDLKNLLMSTLMS